MTGNTEVIDRMLQPKLATILLAAGEGRRFGGNKLLSPWGDSNLLNRALDLTSLLPETWVVLGAYADKIREVIQQHSNRSHIHTVENRNWRNGLGSSIAAGVTILPPAEAVMILLADQIAITQADLRQLIETWRENPDDIVCAKHNEQFGVPAILPARCWPKLRKLKANIGAKTIIAKDTKKRMIHLPNAAIDIDRPSDLTAWLATQGQK